MALTLHLIAFASANVGIILLLVGLFTDHWAGRESQRIDIYEGLWTKCIQHKHSQTTSVLCSPLSEFTEMEHKQFDVVVIFLFFACGIHLITFTLGIIVFCKASVKIEKILAISELACLIASIIGLSLYATQYDSNYYLLKWSYALGWGATLCLFASLVFTIINIDRKRTE